MNDDGTDLILGCYRLARWYHQSPEVFLAMTIGDMQLHLRRTIQLAKKMQEHEDRGDDD